jgi:GNAT superfamily N-acetyltransferase
MNLSLRLAAKEDAADLAAFRTAVAARLTQQHGRGPWSGATSEKGALYSMRMSQVYIARRRGALIASLALQKSKPWAIDKTCFTACRRPLHLVSMAVAPNWQRKGIGRLCIEQAIKFARAFPADALRLDAFDAEAGAGEFYAKCGFHEVGRKIYRGAALIYYEMLLPA